MRICRKEAGLITKYGIAAGGVKLATWIRKGVAVHLPRRSTATNRPKAHVKIVDEASGCTEVVKDLYGGKNASFV